MGDPAFAGRRKAARLVCHLYPSWDDEKALGEVRSARVALPSSRRTAPNSALCRSRTALGGASRRTQGRWPSSLLEMTWAPERRVVPRTVPRFNQNPSAGFGNKTTLERLLLRTSRAREREKRCHVMRIGRLQGGDIAPAKVAGPRQIPPAPTEDRPFLPLGKHIRDQARVAPVAVRERMNQNQPMMDANCKFVRRIGSVLQPIARIPNERAYPLADFVVWHANVLLCGSIDARPLPGLVKHSQMEVSDIRLNQRIASAKATEIEGPRVRFENVLSFPLVKLLFGRKIGNEFCLLVCRQRCVALTLREEHHSSPRFRSRRLVSASTASSTRPTA